MTISAVPVSRRDADLLLFDLLRDPSGVALSAADSMDMVLWKQVLARAREHRCLPSLCTALDHGGISLPDGLAPDQAMQRKWLVQALTLQAEALRLHRLLADAGIAHRFLKGIALAAMAYPQIWQRPMRDIDILVAPSDLVRAHAVLVAQGGVMAQYAHLTPAPAEDAAKHLPPIWSPQRVIAVELHSQAAGPTIGLTAEARTALDAALWRGMQGFAIGGTTLPCPDREAMLLHLVVHGLHDHELNNGPILISDMVHLLRAGPLDGAYLQAQTKAMGLERAMAMALSLLPAPLVAAAGLQALCQDGPPLPVETAVALLLQDKASRNELRLAADLAQSGTMGRVTLLAGRVFATRQTMLSRWQMEQGAAPAPRAWLLLWLWFVHTRLWRMARFAARPRGPAGLGSPPSPKGPRDLRGHLLSLRALRDGNRA